MKRSAGKRLLVAWIVVVAITLLYLAVDRSAAITAIVLALVKLRIIMREFMDVRHAPKVLRSLTDALVVVMGVFLLGTYVVGRAIA